MRKNKIFTTKKGEIVTHNDRKWLVQKILITAHANGGRAYVKAAPIHNGQVLTRSTKTIGDDWV